MERDTLRRTCKAKFIAIKADRRRLTFVHGLFTAFTLTCSSFAFIHEEEILPLVSILIDRHTTVRHIELASYFVASIIGFIYEAFSSKVFLYLAMPFATIYAIGMFVGPIYLAITRPDVDYEKNNPPFIKNKLLFCILLVFVGYLLASVFGALLSIRF